MPGYQIQVERLAELLGLVVRGIDGIDILGPLFLKLHPSTDDGVLGHGISDTLLHSPLFAVVLFLKVPFRTLRLNDALSKLNGPLNRRIIRGLRHHPPLGTELFHPVDQNFGFVFLHLSNAVLIDLFVEFCESLLDLLIHIEIAPRLRPLRLVRCLPFCRLLFPLIAGTLSIGTEVAAASVGGPRFLLVPVRRLPLDRERHLLQLVHPSRQAISRIRSVQIRNIIVFDNLNPLWFHKLSFYHIFGLDRRFGFTFTLGLSSRLPLIRLSKFLGKHIHSRRPGFSSIKLRR